MTLSAYGGLQVGFEPSTHTSKIGGNYLIIKATTKCFKFCIFPSHIQHSIRNKCTKLCVTQNHGFKPMVLCMSKAKPCVQN